MTKLISTLMIAIVLHLTSFPSNWRSIRLVRVNGLPAHSKTVTMTVSCSVQKWRGLFRIEQVAKEFVAHFDDAVVPVGWGKAVPDAIANLFDRAAVAGVTWEPPKANPEQHLPAGA